MNKEEIIDAIFGETARQATFSDFVQRIFTSRHSKSRIEQIMNDLQKTHLDSVSKTRLQIACLSANPK